VVAREARMNAPTSSAAEGGEGGAGLAPVSGTQAPRAVARSIRSRRLLPSLCRGLIATVWIAGALLKLHDPAEFAETIRAHAILPVPAVAAYAVIGVELIVAIALALKIENPKSGAGGPARRPVPETMSLLLAAAMGVYITMVPSAILEAAGCGCAGAGFRPVLGSGSLKLDHSLFTAAFGLLHVPMFIRGRATAPSRTGMPAG